MIRVDTAANNVEHSTATLQQVQPAPHVYVDSCLRTIHGIWQLTLALCAYMKR